MNTLTRLVGGGAAALALALAPLPAVALVPAPAPAQAPVPAVGPLDLSGELDGVPYEIRVPAAWNGTLVMYAHGYRDAADHPGETDDRSAQAFVADPVEDMMLAAGYAVAGSAYRSNGWAVADGIHDTKALVNHFRETVAKPRTTLLAGFSMGSVVAMESIEKHGGVYDGAMPACAVGAGASRTWDSTLAFAMAYDAVFGWPTAWGTPADIRDDLDFESEVLPVVYAELAKPGGGAKLEFLRRVLRAPQGPEWPGGVGFFATEGRAELERRAGGPVTQNADHTYTLGPDDRGALLGLGLTEAQLDGWLADMMSSRVAAVPGPRRYVQRYADYTGRVDGPVLTLGTTVDALVVPAQISAYTATVASAGRSSLLASAWVDRTGHCNFTPQQLLTSVRALDHWAQTGQRPPAFPTAEGFVGHTPPPWPQP
ncbi:MAG: hypothetical protein ACRDT6_17790 [Micromonosporaceae bacterium]